MIHQGNSIGAGVDPPARDLVPRDGQGSQRHCRGLSIALSCDNFIQMPTIVIHQSDEVLASMNEWCIENHGKSGLTEASRASKVTEAQAEV